MAATVGWGKAVAVSRGVDRTSCSQISDGEGSVQYAWLEAGTPSRHGITTDRSRALQANLHPHSVVRTRVCCSTCRRVSAGYSPNPHRPPPWGERVATGTSTLVGSPFCPWYIASFLRLTSRARVVAYRRTPLNDEVAAIRWAGLMVYQRSNGAFHVVKRPK